MNIPGEELKGVYGANLLLESGIHPNYEGKKVAVIGGGNVAMDVARTINKMGAKEVTVIYRRSREEMPAEDKEIKDAENEGIKFLYKTNILKCISSENKDKVSKIECIKTELVKKEGETRLSPVNIDGTNFELDIDFVIMAVGAKADGNAIKDFIKNKWGNIEVDDNLRTSIKKVYAGGDITGGKATVAFAARAGRDAAYTIIEDLKEGT